MLTKPTSPQPQSAWSDALPARWVDSLFDRLAAMYGRHWLDLWADVPMADVKTAWQHGLAGIAGEQLRHALEHCASGAQRFPPTLGEFAAICRAHRVEPAHRLMLPKPRTEMPAHVRDALRAFLDKSRMPA